MATRSTLSHLFSSNEAPLPHEEDCVKQYLQSSRTNLSEVDRQIAKVKRALELLQGIRENLNRKVIAAESIVSPLRRLPNEILAEIFLTSIESQWIPTEGRGSVLDTTTGPWILGRVCQRWSAVIWTLPSAWSRICYASTNSNPHTVSILRTALFRARSAHRYLHITGVVTVKVISIVKELLSFTDYWRELYINVKWTSELIEAFTSVERVYPELRCLAIHGTSQHPFPPELLHTFCHSGQLRKVHIVADNTKWSIARIADLSFPWKQLTHFECVLQYQSVQTDLKLLRKLPNLTYVKVVESYSISEGDSGVGIVELYHLRAIDIRSLQPLCHLRAPNLEMARIRSDYSRASILPFQQLIIRSNCAQSLRFLIFGKLYPDIINILRCTQSLLSLKIDAAKANVSPTRRLINYLTMHPGCPPSQIALPNLEELSLLTPYRKYQDIEDVVSMIRSRWHRVDMGTRRIKSIGLWNKKFDASNHSALLKLEAEGLRYIRIPDWSSFMEEYDYDWRPHGEYW